jgi:hypothetical protein
VDNDGTPDVLTTSTDANGQYHFAGLYPGYYEVSEDDPGTLASPAILVTTTISSGEEQVAEPGLAGPLGVGQEEVLNPDLLFENLFLGSIHGYKFNDVNQNGQDDDEPRIEGVTITLTGDVDGDGEDDRIITATDAAGEYHFIGLYPGAYIVTETPEGQVPTTDPTVSLTIVSGEEVVANDDQAVQLGVGQHKTTDIRLAFGNFSGSPISGRKFQDLNNNGVDDSEPGLGGVTVELWRDGGDGQADFGTGDDVLDATAVTASGTGNYAFDGLEGKYHIRELPPTGSILTTPGNNGDGTYTFDMGTGQPATGVDFGNYFCSDRHEVGDGQYTITADRAGILTVELIGGGNFTVTDPAGSPVPVFAFDGAGNVIVDPTGSSANSDLDPGQERVDILVTTPGTQYVVVVTGASSSTLRVANAVNVDTSASTVLQITGSVCDQLIAVRDDPSSAEESDAKRILVGFVPDAANLNDGVDHPFDGVQYNAGVIDAVFGGPTILRVEIDAGAGDDAIRVGDEILQQSVLTGGDGSDAIRAGGGESTQYGDAGNDLLIGGIADDVLFGGAGDDDIFGGAGADRAFGDDGNDRIVGGEGDDPLLRGGNDDDTITGAAGRDRIIGDGGSDTAYRDAVDLLVSAETINFGTVPEAILLGAIDDVFDDDFVTDGDEDVELDTIDEIIASVIAPPP